MGAGAAAAPARAAAPRRVAAEAVLSQPSTVVTAVQAEAVVADDRDRAAQRTAVRIRCRPRSRSPTRTGRGRTPSQIALEARRAPVRRGDDRDGGRCHRRRRRRGSAARQRPARVTVPSRTASTTRSMTELTRAAVARQPTCRPSGASARPGARAAQSLRTARRDDAGERSRRCASANDRASAACASRSGRTLRRGGRRAAARQTQRDAAIGCSGRIGADGELERLDARVCERRRVRRRRASRAAIPDPCPTRSAAAPPGTRRRAARHRDERDDRRERSARAPSAQGSHTRPGAPRPSGRRMAAVATRRRVRAAAPAGAGRARLTLLGAGRRGGGRGAAGVVERVGELGSRRRGRSVTVGENMAGSRERVG